jgi:hypothetical protein
MVAEILSNVLLGSYTIYLEILQVYGLINAFLILPPPQHDFNMIYDLIILLYEHIAHGLSSYIRPKVLSSTYLYLSED